MKDGEILLNTMYQACDYTFQVEKFDDRKKVRYSISIESAIRHKLNNEIKLIWDREELLLHNFKLMLVLNDQKRHLFKNDPAID